MQDYKIITCMHANKEKILKHFEAIQKWTGKKLIQKII